MAELTIVTQNLNGYYWTKGKRKYELLHEKLLKDIKDAGSAKKVNSNGKETSESYKKILEDIINKENVNSELTVPEAFLEVVKERYIKSHKADIYAFQEVAKLNNGHWSNITETIIPSLPKNARDADCAEEIWYEAFPWNEFRSGYWDECDIEFAGKEIKIINFHSSPTYDLAIRYTLLKRLSNIQGRLTILLGDFNAAFRYQTQSPEDNNIIEGEDFLKEITRKYKFIECIDSKEHKGNPHYTHFYPDESNADEKIKRNKLDHIFISKSLSRLLKKPYEIQYFDEVNYCPIALNEDGKEMDKDKAFTDHSGIMLTIELPDPSDS